ncbi:MULTISPECIES: hypothetical protein [unclassified Halomonas]|uniref:hypothetical protein n=1 Tax=unclassified Halomonas TaxID=2609666 RepID=UPI001C95209C|nr:MULTISPECIES: hypothetical protein [unclassified Halomonas]MBY5925544.1 hypothetical protein [Halomonas sp. DP4Y7-2]MBY6232637.1 hypothetical protein [Halomonas sp. DP4Y7-1]
MKTLRSPLLLVVVPTAAIIVLAAAIFGSQALSDSRLDEDARRALASALGTSSSIELAQLQEVRYGYGLCGSYRLSPEQGFASFYMDTTTGDVELDVNSRRFNTHCGLSALC